MNSQKHFSGATDLVIRALAATEQVCLCRVPQHHPCVHPPLPACMLRACHTERATLSVPH
eukprot:1514449-Prymnesium_polylepis.1